MDRSEEKHKLILHTYFGAFEVCSPLPRAEFLQQKTQAELEHASDPSWPGIFDFTKPDGGEISINLRDIRGVETVPEKPKRRVKKAPPA